MDNRLAILSFLGKNIETAFTMYDLSRRTKIPYASFYRTLKKMADLLILTPAGKATLVRLNKHNPLTRHYLIIASKEEKDQYVKKQPIIKKIADELPPGKYAVILFGSYVKGTQTAKSDIDLLVITSKNWQPLPLSRYETLFRVRINVIYLTSEEFTAMLKEKEENLGKQALKNHIILYNPERFWNLVYGTR